MAAWGEAAAGLTSAMAAAKAAAVETATAMAPAETAGSGLSGSKSATTCMAAETAPVEAAAATRWAKATAVEAASASMAAAEAAPTVESATAAAVETAATAMAAAAPAAMEVATAPAMRRRRGGKAYKQGGDRCDARQEFTTRVHLGAPICAVRTCKGSIGSAWKRHLAWRPASIRRMARCAGRRVRAVIKTGERRMRPKILFVSAAIVCAVGLSGCVRQGDAGGDHVATASTGYCAAFKTTNGSSAQSAPISDPSAAVDDCLHRWAYVLSRSHDPADVVAHATMEACSTALATWSQQASAAQPDQMDEAPRYGRRGAAGGQGAANPMAQRMGMVNAKALFYVVQARAGNCELPPASSLVAPPNPS